MSESRPVKRQRTSHDDQTIKQSIDYLNAVPSDLFSIICSYLSFFAKATLLSLLVPVRFNPTIHCRNDVIHINQSSFERIRRHPGSFESLISICPSVELYVKSNAKEARARSGRRLTNPTDVAQTTDSSIDQHLDLAKPMLSALVDAMTTGKMKSFHFSEVLTKSGTIAPRLQQLTQIVEDTNQPHQLTELLIHVRDSIRSSQCLSFDDMLSRIDLTCFVRGTTLHTLDLAIQNIHSDHPDNGDDTFYSLLNELPSSLTFVKLLGPWEYWEDYACEFLARPNWLPNVRHLDLGHGIKSCPELYTTMTETGTQRQYKWLDLSVEVYGLMTDYLNNIRHLFIRMCEFRQNYLADFSSMNAATLPNLKSFGLQADFDIFGHTILVDVSPALLFLSNRPIESLVLNVSDPFGHAALPISDTALCALSTLHSLTSFDLTIQSPLNGTNKLITDDSITRLITPNCWPLLNTFKWRSNQSLPQLQAFVNAAPNLKDVSLAAISEIKSPFFPVAHVAMLHRCPSLTSLVVDCRRKIDEPDGVILNAFRDIVSPFSCLSNFKLTCPDMSDKLLHSFISHFSSSPIREFQFPPIAWARDVASRSYDLPIFRLVMQQRFTHLTHVWPGTSGTRARSIQGMQYKFDDGTNFPFEDVGDSILNFRTIRDEHRRDGREAFFHWLNERLTEKEKDTLIAWNTSCDDKDLSVLDESNKTSQSVHSDSGV